MPILYPVCTVFDKYWCSFVGVKSNLVFLVNCWLVQVGVQRLLLLHPKTPCRHWVVVGPQPDLGWVVQVERAVEGGFCREIMIDLIF